MKAQFLGRGYPEKIIDIAIQKARNKERDDLLAIQSKEIVKMSAVPVVINYNPALPNTFIRQIFEKKKPILYRNPDTMGLANLSFLTTFRRAPNLRNLLVKSDISPRQYNKGSRPCGKSCYLCKMMNTATSITSTSNRYKIEIKKEITCNTRNVIYLIECKKCKKQYVGQTGNSLKERFRGHLQDINTANKFKPVSKHFTSEGHSKNDVIITGVTTTVDNVNVRLRTEEAIIYKLATAEPWGLNIRT